MNLLDNLGNCLYVVERSEFETMFLHTLNKHAPLKKRFIRANNAPFMTKTLCKAIMVRSRLRNKSLKLKSMESMEAYKKQRNYCVSLLRKAKKDYYEQLHVETIIDNKKFGSMLLSLSFQIKSHLTQKLLTLRQMKLSLTQQNVLKF